MRLNTERESFEIGQSKKKLRKQFLHIVENMGASKVGKRFRVGRECTRKESLVAKVLVFPRFLTVGNVYLVVHHLQISIECTCGRAETLIVG